MREASRRCVALLVVGLLAACGSGDEAGTAWDCSPGASIPCSCSDGRAGVGTCGREGCDCGPVDPGRIEVEAPIADPTGIHGRGEFDDVPRAEGRGLRIVPDELDFGTVWAGCGVSDLELRLVNGTLDPVTVGRPDVEGPGSFFVRSEPPAGSTLGPGASARIVVAFRPQRFGEEFGLASTSTRSPETGKGAAPKTARPRNPASG